MLERHLFIYIAAVMIFTILPIRGQNVTCQYNGFRVFNGECYRINNDEVTWMVAMDQCEKWNGKLATFTSLDHALQITKDLGDSYYDLWIGDPNEPRVMGSQWSFYTEGYSYFVYFSKNCKNEKKSICAEMYNKTSLNNATLKTATKRTVEVDSAAKEQIILNESIKKEICSQEGYVPVNGQCYRLANKSLSSSNNKCYKQNETLATISSVEQVIRILKAFNLNHISIWANYQFNDVNGNYLDMYDDKSCIQFLLGNMTERHVPVNAFCMMTPITYSDSATTPESTTTTDSTTRPVSTTTPESTTTSKLTTTNESAFKQPPFNRPESSTTQIGRNKIENQNRLLLVNRLMIAFNYKTRID